ncbi:hypothetical protein [Chitinophaga barathri]|uniref:Uncharacterized protein n=1 Tax=Chitinophaga barathri TaxID=1647451 RepID=A0A3N4MAU7_9BACT|nr:hypothetical protein [Chitinophaga barathri]RPD40608.1 hypothetical protein EG028_15020 [Chitinophaga barathri]
MTHVPTSGPWPPAPYFPHYRDYNATGYNPLKIIKAIFSDFLLDEMREDLYQMFTSAILNDSVYSERKARSGLIFTYETLNDLILASHRLTGARPDELAKEEDDE